MSPSPTLNHPTVSTGRYGQCPNCGREAVRKTNIIDSARNNFPLVVKVLNPVTYAWIGWKLIKGGIIDAKRSDIVDNCGTFKCSYCSHYLVKCAKCGSLASFGKKSGLYVDDYARCPGCGNQVRALKV